VHPETWGGSEWQAVAAFVAIFVAGPITFWQVMEARKVRLDQARPYVVVDFEFRNVLIYLRIQNIGKTMARDVRVKFDEPLTSTLANSAALTSRLLSEPIPMLAPGRSVSLIFDSFPSRYERQHEFPLSYSVMIEYDDDRGQPFNDPPYPLDLGSYAEASLDPKGLPDLVGEIVKLRQELHKWTDTSRRGLRMNTASRRVEDRREFHALRRRRRIRTLRAEGLRAVVQQAAGRAMGKLGLRPPHHSGRTR
jgi:hypothetical protein